jgi:hypothetical protein
MTQTESPLTVTQIKHVYVVMNRKNGAFYGVAGSHSEAEKISREWGGSAKCTIMPTLVAFNS